MGNIKSFCCRDSISAEDDQEERARIINDQYLSTNSLYNNSTNSGQDDMSYGSLDNCGGGSKTMEQSALDRIYQRMAANVIDVAPGESMVIQPAEYIERQKAYQARLSQIRTPIQLRSADRTPKQQTLDTSTTSRANNTKINSGSSSPSHANKSQQEKYEPIVTEEIQLINEISERTVQAFNGLKINSREQVVTNFKP